MRVTCPECQAKYDIIDEALIAQIKRSPSLRKQVATILGHLIGGKIKLNAECRRARALKAVHSREAKRKTNPTFTKTSYEKA